MASQVIHWLNAVDWDFTPLQRQAAIWLFNTLEITFLLHWDELIMGCRTGTRLFADTFLLIAIEEMRQSTWEGVHTSSKRLGVLIGVSCADSKPGEEFRYQHSFLVLPLLSQ